VRSWFGVGVTQIRCLSFIRFWSLCTILQSQKFVVILHDSIKAIVESRGAVSELHIKHLPPFHLGCYRFFFLPKWHELLRGLRSFDITLIGLSNLKLALTEPESVETDEGTLTWNTEQLAFLIQFSRMLLKHLVLVEHLGIAGQHNAFVGSENNGFHFLGRCSSTSS
jgi:hypothetical protein